MSELHSVGATSLGARNLTNGVQSVHQQERGFFGKSIVDVSARQATFDVGD